MDILFVLQSEKEGAASDGQGWHVIQAEAKGEAPPWIIMTWIKINPMVMRHLGLLLAAFEALS